MRTNITFSFFPLFLSLGCAQLSKFANQGPTPSLKPFAIYRAYTPGDRELFHVLPLAGSAADRESVRFELELEDSTRLVSSDVTVAGTLWRVEFKNLKSPAKTLFVQKPGEEVIDQRDLPRPSLQRVALVSCLHDKMESVQVQAWRQLALQKPTMILMIGDNVYADFFDGKWVGSATEEILKVRYRETRERLEIFRSSTLPMVHAIWDDHDFGKNDGGAEYPLRHKAKMLFDEYFPRDPLLKSGFGVGSAFEIDGVLFVFADNRYYRQPGKTHWGKSQTKWILNRIKSHKGAVVLVQGDQFFGGYHRFESMQKANPQDLETLIQKLKRQSPHKPVLLLSGDRHISEILKVQPSTDMNPIYEITSSPIHATVFPNPWNESPSPNQVVGVANEYNFVLLDLKFQRSSKPQLTVHSQSLNPEGKMLWDYEFVQFGLGKSDFQKN